jgi:hypothetical protein
MRHTCKALALVLASALSARAEEAPKAKPASSSSSSSSSGSASHSGGGRASADTGLLVLDLFFNVLSLGIQVAVLDDAMSHVPPAPLEDSLARRYGDPEDDDPPPSWRRTRRQFQSREGLLMSFGLGGGSMYISSERGGRAGAFDLDFRLGYGFSDRFQFFMDVGLAGANSAYGGDIASWTATMRGQTVLLGDRSGNGLNLNLGVGLGGITRNNGYNDQVSSPTGLALAGGISYDARLSPHFSLSPEFFVTWHAIPNRPGLPQDVASMYGVRVNFLWYLH